MEASVTLTYYDRILLAIAVSLSGGALTGLLTGVRFQTGILVGAVVATLFLYRWSRPSASGSSENRRFSG